MTLASDLFYLPGRAPRAGGREAPQQLVRLAEGEPQGPMRNGLAEAAAATGPAEEWRKSRRDGVQTSGRHSKVANSSLQM